MTIFKRVSVNIYTRIYARNAGHLLIFRGIYIFIIDLKVVKKIISNVNDACCNTPFIPICLSLFDYHAF